MTENREKKTFNGFVVPPDPNAKPGDKPNAFNADGTLKTGVGKYVLTLEYDKSPATK